MPAETQRLQRRLGTRDRVFLALFGVAAVAGSTVAIVMADPGGITLKAGCVSQTQAYTMGAATGQYCGTYAVTFCAKAAATDKSVAAQCARLTAATTK